MSAPSQMQYQGKPAKKKTVKLATLKKTSGAKKAGC